jgi:transcriptional regulator with XRE-family HTH domain
VLSQAAGVGKSLVSILEGGGGRVPRLDTVELLAVALSLSPSFLAFGIELPVEPATELRSKGFAARLSEARRERGLSMRAVDKRAGISPGSTRSLEAGTMPSLDTLELISKALGVSPAWLAYGEGPREDPRRRSHQSPDTDSLGGGPDV